MLALLDEEPTTAEVCTCTVKCEAGNVNENCPLCEKSNCGFLDCQVCEILLDRVLNRLRQILYLCLLYTSRCV